jgi:hypothetical protein
MKRIILVRSVLVLILCYFTDAPHQVAAQVATHTITATQGANGTIAPDTAAVNDGFSQLFTIAPAAGFYIADVSVDGSSVGSHAAYRFANVTADHSISASFALMPVGADMIPGTVMDVSSPTRFTLDPGTPGPFVWFVVMNSNIKIINGNKTIIPGPTTLVIDRLGQLMSAGTTSGITAFRDQVVVSGRAEPDNAGFFPLSIVDISVPALPPSDTTAPVITLNGANPLNLTVGGAFSDPGATAFDAVDGAVAVKASGAVDTTTVGVYTISYTATDAAQNIATTTRTVNVDPVPATAVRVTTFAYDARSSSISLKWSSTSGQAYAIDYTQNLGTWTVLTPNVPGTQGSTTYTGNVPSGDRGFFRVRPAS